MTEDQLRALVRESLARHLGASPAPVAQGFSPRSAPVAQGFGPGSTPVAQGFGLASAPVAQGFSPAVVPPWRGHPSHVRFVLVTGRDSDGPCLVEPAVGCTHCGYCQSYGH